MSYNVTLELMRPQWAEATVKLMALGTTSTDLTLPPFRFNLLGQRVPCEGKFFHRKVLSCELRVAASREYRCKVRDHGTYNQQQNHEGFVIAVCRSRAPGGATLASAPLETLQRTSKI
jgi:hypothetical protein